jgi:penicillin-binding protein 1A
MGMINGPGIYSPINHPENALNRRNFVLRRMNEEGFLSDGQTEEYKAKPLGLTLKLLTITRVWQPTLGRC